jgi:hypothetical protein
LLPAGNINGFAVENATPHITTQSAVKGANIQVKGCAFGADANSRAVNLGSSSAHPTVARRHRTSAAVAKLRR